MYRLEIELRYSANLGKKKGVNGPSVELFLLKSKSAARYVYLDQMENTLKQLS